MALTTRCLPQGSAVSASGVFPPSREPREHPTSNIERPTSKDSPNAGHWMFEVGCWVLDVQRIGEISLPRPKTPDRQTALARAAGKEMLAGEVQSRLRL